MRAARERGAIVVVVAHRPIGIEVALVPIAGTRYLVPFRTVIPTPLGTAVLEATHFMTQATPPHVAKTQ